MSEYYVCRKCNNRIHQSRVPNSITGIVLCCGEPMSAPGDFARGVAALFVLASIAAGTWTLTSLAGWGFLGALIVATIGSLVLLVVAVSLVSALWPRAKERNPLLRIREMRRL